MISEQHDTGATMQWWLTVSASEIAVIRRVKIYSIAITGMGPPYTDLILKSL